MGGWYFTMKDGTLTYDPTRVQNMVNSLEYPGRRIQPHNYTDAIQYTRMAYMINLLSDEEIAKELVAFGYDFDDYAFEGTLRDAMMKELAKEETKC